jgi:Cu/Ag efflux pump CusA
MKCYFIELSRSQLAVKFLGQIWTNYVKSVRKSKPKFCQTVDGIVVSQLEPQIPIPQIRDPFDRLIRRYGLKIGDMAEIIETGLNGRIVSQSPWCANKPLIYWYG